MDASVLAPWRDLSIVWLVLLTMIFIAVPGAVLFYAVRGMRALNRWLRLPLLNAQVWALRIQHSTTRAADSVAEVPIRMHSAGARVLVTAHGIVDFLRNY